ncbi:MAG: hypothetical protein OEM05_09275 [Myxococcales bacterium]|nr:hypothetical protein [Myxococcales bacterium]
MRFRGWLALLGAAAIAVSACSTTDSRIRRQQTLFEGYPPEVQQNIRNGGIEIGYGPEMVRMALGEPDRKIQVQSGDGASEIWTYRKSVPGFSVGMGSGGTIGSRVGVGTRVTMGEPPRSEDRVVVEFWEGRVSRFELATK